MGTLNGDSRETGKLTPEGTPDPSVFSTERNREGIRVGTAVGLFVVTGKKRRVPLAAVAWRDFWGISKRQNLLESLSGDGSGYACVLPTKETRWSFKPQTASSSYRSWPRIVDLCEKEPISGLAEMRRGGLLAIERDVLDQRMQEYFDRGQTWVQVQQDLGGLREDAGRYPAEETRSRLMKNGEVFASESIRRYALLPFDTRWCYHSNARPLWNEPRPSLTAQLWDGNRFLVTRMNAERPGEQHVSTSVTALPDYHLLRPNVVAIPMLWRDSVLGLETTRPNLSAKARAYLAAIGFSDPADDESAATALWYHCLAVTYSSEYVSENGDAIRADFPRIPLPADPHLLERSSRLGRQLADLLDPDVEVPGVASGSIREDLRPLGTLRRSDDGQIDPSSGDLRLEARWGSLQRGSVVMPGPGRISKAIEPGLEKHRLGASALDVWLNERAFWHAVPDTVWDFTIGGYQVVKKWLSYREVGVLGRDLRLDEALYVTTMIRRIAAILLLEADLNETYRSCRDGAFAESG